MSGMGGIDLTRGSYAAQTCPAHLPIWVERDRLVWLPADLICAILRSWISQNEIAYEAKHTCRCWMWPLRPSGFKRSKIKPRSNGNGKDESRNSLSGSALGKAGSPRWAGGLFRGSRWLEKCES